MGHFLDIIQAGTQLTDKLKTTTLVLQTESL